MSFEPITPPQELVEEFPTSNDKLDKQTKTAYIISGLVLITVIAWAISMI